MMAMRKILGFGGLAALCFIGSAMAQDYAPTPRKSPRVPVSQQQLSEQHKVKMPASRNVSGTAVIIDNEKLRIGEIEMRLFGVVPPQLSASFGPQTRAVLDKLTSGVSTNCVIRDRDRDGRFLATCAGAGNADLATELLRRGLAITARGSLRPTELAVPYETAEQAAEAARIGLWSVNPPAAAPNAPPVVKKVEEKAPELIAISAQQLEKSEITPKNDEATLQNNEKSTVISPPENEENKAQAIQEMFSENILPVDVYELGFFSRYQILVTGLLMLLTALSIIFAVMFQRWQEKREELRSIAAAIRGELMAARSVCQARLKSIPEDADEKNMTWPRIRILVFQAYVGRIGRLGATLARQVASIYGQTSDYAAYYGAAIEPKSDKVSKRRALQMLVQHIEEVLPRLASIETGKAMMASANKTNNRLEFKTEAKPLSLEPPIKMETEKEVVEENNEPSVEEETPKDSNIETSEPAATASPTTPLWDKIRKFATERMDVGRRINLEDDVPDYTNMTEEEIEALAYAEILEEEEPQQIVNKGKKRKAG